MSKRINKYSGTGLGVFFVLLLASQSVMGENINDSTMDVLKKAILVNLDKKAKTNKYQKNKQGNIGKKQPTTRFILRLNQGDSVESFTEQLSKTSSKAYNFEVVRSFKTSKGSFIVVLEPEVNSLSSSSISTMMSGLRSLSNVEVVEKDTPLSIHTNDPDYDALWGLSNTGQTGGTVDADIDAPEAWSISTGSKSVIVGVIDTGIDYNHPDLVGNIWQNTLEVNGMLGVDDDSNGYVDDFYGIDTGNNDTDPMDDNNHGTHVAGTIGATGNNEEGIVGVNHQVQIASCKFLDSSGFGSTSTAMECIEYFTSLKLAGHNVVATNNSWGQEGGGLTPEGILLRDSIEEAGEAGVIFVAAAGNSYVNNDITPHYPAAFTSDNIISVAASDHNDQKPNFSNYGLVTTDLAAPGADIYSTVVSSSEYTCGKDASDLLWSDDFNSPGLPGWQRRAYNMVDPDTEIVGLRWLKTTDVLSGYAIDDSRFGNYIDNLMTVISKDDSIDLSTAVGTVCISLKVKGVNEANYDFLNVAVSRNDGASWEILASYDKSTSNFEELNLQLPDLYKTEQFKISLIRTSDFSVSYSGYIVDDVSISQGGEAVRTANYASFNGTSMAAPHVTGAIALAASVLPDELMEDRIARVLNNVDAIPSLSGLVATGGRLNIANMLEGLNLGISGKAANFWASSNWKTVSLVASGLTSEPVVILGPPTSRDVDPVTVRISDITTGTFKLKLQEWAYQDGSHSPEVLSFLALEPGVYNFPDGSILEVGSVLASGGKADISTYSFTGDFPVAPEVLTTVQTNNDAQPVTSRVKSISKSSFAVSLYEEDAASGDHAEERVGFIAFYSAGSVSPILSLSGREYKVEWIHNRLNHNWLTVLGKDMKLQEDTSVDVELIHGKEFVSVLKLVSGGQVLNFAQDVSSRGRDTVVIRKR